MENINRVAELSLSALKKHGASRAQVDVTATETQELNVDSGRFSLMRTTFDQGIRMRALVGDRQAALSGNQLGDSDIETLARQAVQTAQISPEDPAFDIAPMQKPQTFSSGLPAGHTDLMLSRTDEFLRQLKSRWPKVILEQLVVQFVRKHHIVANTNGVFFQINDGHYQMFYVFTGKDGKKTSSFNYNQVSTQKFDSEIWQMGGASELLKQSGEQTEAQPFAGKFVGPVVVTPHCLPAFLGALTSYLQTGPLLRGQSLYQDKVGGAIAHPGFSLRAMPLSPDFASPGFVTSDGFVAENIDIVKGGVLQTFLLDQYGANKLKAARAKSDNAYHVVDPGISSLEQMISSVQKGVLLCRFSAGYPASNGDISGVAKNSYLIEDGKITKPITEVMVSGNIAKMFHAIGAISRETINSGSSKLPWICFDEMTVSGRNEVH